MKAKVVNKERIEGRVYDHNLAIKTVQNTESKNYGKEFIGGTLDVATDDDCLNVIQVNYTYVTETTAKGNKNNTYTALKNIIENGKTILNDGKDAATMVRIDTSLALNDFYTNRNGEETLVSAKRNEGGFVTIINSLGEEDNRNTFEFDMLINGTQYIEADEERNIAEDYLIVKGAVFNFKNDILPVELVCRNKGGIKYFESLDASPQNLTFTKVWGKITSQTIVRRVEEESAFGEPAVKEYTRTSREWVITGTSKPDSVYEIGDAENGITTEDIKKAMADREVHLADVKKRQDEYQASKNAGGGSSSPAPAAVSADSFNF